MSPIHQPYCTVCLLIKHLQIEWLFGVIRRIGGISVVYMAMYRQSSIENILAFRMLFNLYAQTVALDDNHADENTGIFAFSGAVCIHFKYASDRFITSVFWFSCIQPTKLMEVPIHNSIRSFKPESNSSITVNANIIYYNISPSPLLYKQNKQWIY